MIHVSYVNHKYQTITKDFDTNVSLVAWLNKASGPYSTIRCIYIRFKDGHNVEYFRNDRTLDWGLTYAE